jgi:pescadillo
VDALSDLDDALTLTYLFAALPAAKGIKPSMVSKAKKLVAAWGAYCATTHSITKSFISIKGVYLEATVENVAIRWIVPHSFAHRLPKAVDYRVMMTFFEFYDTLLSFVLFKLYNDIGVRYPFPLRDLGGEAMGSTSSILGLNLRALTNALNSSTGAISTAIAATLGGQDTEQVSDKKAGDSNKKDPKLSKIVDAALVNLPEEKDDEDEMDDDEEDDENEEVATPLESALQENAKSYKISTVPEKLSEILDDAALKRKRLYEGLTFFLSREVPRGYLELICLAFGGKVGWEADDSPISMKDPAITHHIVDRSELPKSYQTLPKAREYVQPQWILDCSNQMFLLPIARYSVGATLPPHLSPWVNHEEEGYKPAYADEIERLKTGEEVDMNEEQDNEEEAFVSETESIDAIEDEESDEEETEEVEADAAEVEKEAKPKSKKRKSDVDEAHELAKTMMNRKAKNLYDRMQYGIAQKKAKVDLLQQRRKEIESTREKDASGKTVQKLKVERLKSERKAIEDSYENSGGTMKKSKKNKKSK